MRGQQLEGDMSPIHQNDSLGSPESIYSNEDATVATKEFLGCLVLHQGCGDREKHEAEKTRRC